MPRSARIDLPGLLQHVIVRGVAREVIFRDEEDRERFCARLSSLLVDTGTECLAWALLSNHVHLLLRRWDVPLSTFMRRLLTGYAVTFNKRHGRSGHLFQNRYKSIVCEEEPYLLELVRYIHLNPIRAGLVLGVEGLRRYRWSGHAVLMGAREFPGQAVEEVLCRFGRTVREARQEYERFVAAGVKQGRRDELVGGGLRRSLKVLGRGKEREAYDERVLGSGEFVEELWRREELREELRPPLAVEEVVERVAVRYGLEPERVLRRSTDPRVSVA
ncbi:MAG: transposase, partial [Deltaproteobacteria bacterium]|nr:transposase [Deltaproteobacteria bacterium]